MREIIEHPRHPYTQGLIKCVPHLRADPGDTREELIEIPGTVPDPSQLGAGCAFAPRCTYAMGQCTENIPPPTVEIGDDHLLACWLAGTV